MRGLVSKVGAVAVLSYDDVVDLAADAAPLESKSIDWMYGVDDWQDFFGLDVDQLFAALHGDDVGGAAARVEAAAAHSAQLPDTPRIERVLDVCGGLPCVPAYLAGHPGNMVRYSRLPDAAPIRLFWNIVSSQGYSAERLAERAAPILATIHAHAAWRPIELIAVIGMRPMGTHDVIVTVKLPSVPWMLSTIASPIVCAGVARHLYPICTELALGWWPPKHEIGWPHCDVRKILCGPNDIYIEPPRLGEGEIGLQVDEALRRMTT